MTVRSLLVAAAAAALLTGPATAQVTDKPADDIYLEVSKNDNGRARVLFVIADSTQSTLTPTDSFTIEVPQAKTCSFDFDTTATLSDASAKPIYGPGSEQQSVAFEKLSVFFASKVSSEIAEQKIFERETQIVPYFNCTGLVWAKLLSSPFEQDASTDN
ncbi:MAG: hypothetical protein AAFR16_14870 [Pseudomonadota bacterium]